ncbi:MAG TPA: hypothetical protein VIS54_04915 [Psychromonas sp.]
MAQLTAVLWLFLDYVLRFSVQHNEQEEGKSDALLFVFAVVDGGIAVAVLRY